MPSACESGKGKVSNGEGMVGMVWAFMIAGVPTTVVSQWKVDSASTSHLMTDLHLNLARSGLDQYQKSSNAEALRDAAVKLMQRPQYRHPFFWAGFIVLGSDQ